jgi:uncharacterized protein (DUF433 family)
MDSVRVVISWGEIEERIMAEPQMDWTLCHIVEIVPGRLSGAPMVKNTRLPVDAILTNYDAGLEPEEVAAIFEVAVADVRTILAFREEQLASTA